MAETKSRTGWSRKAADGQSRADSNHPCRGPESDPGIILEFTAASEPEVISWILSFGPEASLLSPEPCGNPWCRKFPP